MELSGSSTGSKRRRIVEDEEENEPTPASGGQNITFTSSKITNSGGGSVTVGSHNHLNVTRIYHGQGSREERHEDVCNRIADRLHSYVVQTARLDNFHQACYSGTRRELLRLLARWIAGKDVHIDVDDDLNVDEGSDMNEDSDTDDNLGTDNDWEDRRQTHRRSSFRRVFASLRQCACIVGRPGSGKSTITTTVIAKLLDTCKVSTPHVSHHPHHLMYLSRGSAIL
jgi:ABC-type multidrug transport system fused ATPase/permease subunit